MVLRVKATARGTANHTVTQESGRAELSLSAPLSLYSCTSRRPGGGSPHSVKGDLLKVCNYNQFQLYTEHTFRYAGHEAVWRNASPLTPAEIRELDLYCRMNDIELVPNQNSFGFNLSWHQGFFQCQLFISAGQTIGVSASASVLPMSIQY